MISLSTSGYYLEGVSEDFFWKELNKITAGGADPEFLDFPTTANKSQKTFYGRRLDNKFSISLNQHLEQFVRSGVVAKGIVSKKGSGLMIHCSFKYPVLSLFAVLTVASYIFVRFLPILLIQGLGFGLIVTGLYFLLIKRSHSTIKHELKKQMEIIEQKAKTESTKMQRL
jgi:uncharacterized membrane protein YciS (DUF1049 family)